MQDRKLSGYRGVSMFRGTVCIDADDWTFGQAIRAEANSRYDAELARMQTTVSPSNGYSVMFDADADATVKRNYEAAVAEELALLKR